MQHHRVAVCRIAPFTDTGTGCDEIKAGTLHAFCFALLGKQEVFDFLGRRARPVITFSKSGVLQFEGWAMLEDLVSEGNFGTKRDCTKRIRAFEAAWARLQSETPGWPNDALDKQFQAALINWLTFHEAMLIGELVPLALRFLKNNPACSARSAFDHVIVDEYQDLNRAEQDLIDLLAENGTTSVVGDVDQSIYRFRHANPEGITNFNATHVRLNAEQAGWVLNCQPHDIPALIHARLIKPLGNPSANSARYFATADLLETARDRSWLVKMTAAINAHWHRQNARKKNGMQGEAARLVELSAA